MKSMEDDIDIYGDLPDFGPEFSKNFVSNNTEENTAEEQLELKKQIAELTAKLEKSQMANKSLEINLFSLLKTAKAEIARKDKTIDELRKRLDDATFRRSSYSNEHVTRKSSFCRTVANTHQKSIDICFPADEKSAETSSVAISLSNQSKDQQNKSSTLVPITVFGERLLKRMTDEQNLEKKDKSNKLITNSDNDDKNNAGYTVESDKENGFSRDTANFDMNINTKEIQPSATAQHRGSENLSTGAESRAKDLRSNDKNETSSTFQRKPKTLATHTAGYKRRANEEGNGHVHVKRIKSSGEKQSSSFVEATKKETDDNTVFSESKDKSSARLPRYSDFGFSDFCSNEKARDKKYSEYARTWSNMELKKHGCFDMVHDANKADERRDAKNKGDMNKRDTNDRSLKRRDKSAQSSTSISDKKDTSYRGFVEVYEKDSFHRHGHSEHRGSRDKQWDYHRTDDHRPSRARSTSYATKLYREEKYHKSQYHSNNKNNDHDGGSKLEERCNFRNNGAASKSKICKKDSYNDRQTKRSTAVFDRTSTDQRKIRNIDKSIRRQEESSKQDDEHGECLRSRRNFDAENLNTEHPRYGQVSKEIDEKRNSETTEIGNENIPRREHGGKELKNRSINFEGDEISEHRRNRNSSKDDTCDVGPRAAEEDTSLNAANDTSIKRSGTEERNETERWEASRDVPRTIPILDTNVACLPGEKISKNIESVENIENFIRSSVSTRDKANANANVFVDNSQSGSIKVGKVEMQGNANAPNASPDDAAMSFVENLQTDHDVSNVATSNENQRLKIESNVLETVSRNTEGQTQKNNARNTAGADLVTNDDDIGNDCHNVNCDRDENGNASIAMEVVGRTLAGEERDKVRGKGEKKTEESSRVFKEPLEKSINRSNNESSRKDSTNVYGKIVVFARRKKPVCLADSNANMTVLINNNKRDDTGVDLSSGDDVGKVSG